MIKPKIICVVGATGSGKTGLGVEIAKKFDGEIVSADSRQVYQELNISSGKEGAVVAPHKSTPLRSPSFAGQANSVTKVQKYKSNVPNARLHPPSKPGIRHESNNEVSMPWIIDGIPQWLMDVVEPGERFTMFDWLKLAREKIEEIVSRGKLPIIVGGTMLYVSALIEGYALKSQITNSKLQTNSKSKISNRTNYTREELELKSLPELQKIFYKLPATDSQLDTNNPRRLIRAIERARAGEDATKSESDYQSLLIGVNLPREKLYQRIDQRVEERFRQGMLQEIKNLLQIQNQDAISTRGVGLPVRLWRNSPGVGDIDEQMAGWLVGLGLDFRVMTHYLLDNGIDALASGEKFDEMVRRFKFAEHDYARRQLTWWRKKEVAWVKDSREAILQIDKFQR